MAHVFNHLVPSWWHCFGDCGPFGRWRPNWRKWVAELNLRPSSDWNAPLAGPSHDTTSSSLHQQKVHLNLLQSAAGKASHTSMPLREHTGTMLLPLREDKGPGSRGEKSQVWGFKFHLPTRAGISF